ncbi:MAG: hypothetical protein HFG63_08305 [Lachnospiraceae bacterium]|nr:hypothetical protein [Lachnospiraceae bacterium]
MNISLIRQADGLQYNITNAVSRTEWSGSAGSAARQMTVDYINAPDDHFSIPRICTGDLVSFSPDSEEVFYGQFFGSEKSSVVGTISYTAYDMMKNMLESEVQYNFKNVTPEAVGKRVCDEIQIPVRYLYPTGVNIKSMLCDGMSPYDVIMAAYTKAHRITGDKYFPMIYKRGFAVYKTEWVVAGFALDDSENITESSIEETMDSIVNCVKIFDEKGNQTGEVSDQESRSVYGTFQKVYKQEGGVDPAAAAGSHLCTAPSQRIRIRSLGDRNCLSCYYVTLRDSATGLTGLYWIASDRHVWENGIYTMELELVFDSIMDTKETDKEA